MAGRLAWPLLAYGRLCGLQESLNTGYSGAWISYEHQRSTCQLRQGLLESWGTSCRAFWPPCQPKRPWLPSGRGGGAPFPDWQLEELTQCSSGLQGAPVPQDSLRSGTQPCAETDHQNLAATLSCTTIVLGYSATHEEYTLVTTALYAQPEMYIDCLCIQRMHTKFVYLHTCQIPKGAIFVPQHICISALLCKDTIQQQWSLGG